MMKIIADTHTHTVASGHAFSTLHENASAAAQLGLKFLIDTEHTGDLPGAPANLFFQNIEAFPHMLEGVHLVFGCEVNVIDYEGGIDLPETILKKLEWVIASMHSQVLDAKTSKEHTAAWMGIARNPYVDVIGHCGNAQYYFDYEPVIKEFSHYGKIVEINTHSFCARPGSQENCEQIALLCKKHSVPLVVCSDAHCEINVGNFDEGIKLLKKIDFPQELVLNADPVRFAKVLHEKCGRTFDLG